jgi:hypothetical protein
MAVGLVIAAVFRQRAIRACEYPSSLTFVRASDHFGRCPDRRTPRRRCVRLGRTPQRRAGRRRRPNRRTNDLSRSIPIPPRVFLVALAMGRTGRSCQPTLERTSKWPSGRELDNPTAHDRSCRM